MPIQGSPWTSERSWAALYHGPNFRQEPPGSSCHWPLPGRQVERHGSPGILPYAPLLPRLEISSQGPARHPSSSGHSWFCSQEQDMSCRRCGKENETGFHVLNHGEEGLQLTRKRHNAIQDLLESLLVKQGHNVTINNAIPGQTLRQDVEFRLSGSRVMVDVGVCYDQPGSMENAYQQKTINILRMGGFSPLLSGLLDHGTPGTTKSVPFLESMEDPGVPSDSRPDWQRSRDQWIWCVPIFIMVHRTPKLRISPLFP